MSHGGHAVKIDSRFNLPVLSLCLLMASGCSMLQERIHARTVYTPQTRVIGKSSAIIQQVSHQTHPLRQIYVVGHGWHTGIVLRVADVSPDTWPEISRFRDSDYIEIGWGDEGFYRMDGLKIGTAAAAAAAATAAAALLPTVSVLHVAGFRGQPEELFTASDVIRVEMTQASHTRLCRYIADTLKRDDEGRAEDLGEGLYGDSQFYRSHEHYFLPKTCNVWTARALHTADLPITPALNVTAEAVVRRVQTLGKTLNKSDTRIKRLALESSSETTE